MNIEARKISLVKEFLNIDNEDIIEEIEVLLNKNRIKSYEKNLTPKTMAQYKAEIERAIDDEKNGRLIKVENLKNEIKKWH